MYTGAHFCYKIVHCGIWDWSIVGNVPQWAPHKMASILHSPPRILCHRQIIMHVVSAFVLNTKSNDVLKRTYALKLLRCNRSTSLFMMLTQLCLHLDDKSSWIKCGRPDWWRMSAEKLGYSLEREEYMCGETKYQWILNFSKLSEGSE